MSDLRHVVCTKPKAGLFNWKPVCLQHRQVDQCAILPTTLPILQEFPREPAELHQEERRTETDYFRYKSLLSRLIQIVFGAKAKQRSRTKAASIGKIGKATARGKQSAVLAGRPRAFRAQSYQPNVIQFVWQNELSTLENSDYNLSPMTGARL
jgi:hypothetical protein